MHWEVIPKKLQISEFPYKSGKIKGKIESYRSITLQNNILKMLDSLILNKILCETHNKISKSQYGFRKGFSLYNQHIDRI